MKRTFYLVHDEARRRAIQCVSEAPTGYVVECKEPVRNLDQNALLWVLLHKFSTQLKWPVNGEMVSLSTEDWKDLLTAAFRQETSRIAMGLSGGVVMLGTRTSKMGRKEFAEFIEFVQSVAADRGVELT